MTVSQAVNLAGFPVVDNHCHGFDPAILLGLSESEWTQRLTMLGMCYMTSGADDEELASQAAMLQSSTVFALTAERWLRELLGVSEDSSLAGVRYDLLSASPSSYMQRLLSDQCIVALLTDDGYPEPPIGRAGFQKTVGVPVFRVARIEPWIADLRTDCPTLDSLETAFRARLEEAADDSHCVAYKSIIAYRSGLDVTNPTRDEAALAYPLWRESAWTEGRGPSKTVRDYLLHVTLQVARQAQRPVHLHVGGGDPDVQLPHARPQDLFPLLGSYVNQPIVLIHAGYPWIAEAAYLASIFPYVYLDLSAFIPWASLAMDRELETLLGIVPTAKLLYGSDEASEPEVLWLAARLARAALERVLSSAVERDHLVLAEATRIGRGILSDNSVRLHGISI